MHPNLGMTQESTFEWLDELFCNKKANAAVKGPVEPELV